MMWISIFCLLVLSVFLLAGYARNRTNGSMIISGRRRRYLLYVPPSCDPAVPAPLVICFHGFVQWPAHQQRLSGWNRLADRYGFLVVYPRGSGFPLRWNAGPISEDQDRAERDIQFVDALIDQLCENYNLDTVRIYANGMSNGGGMTHLLACRMPDRIAACGGVAGAYLYPGEPYPPARPVPWIAFHGIQDPVVPYGGGYSRRSRHHAIQFPAVESWAAGWAENNGCRQEPEIDRISPAVERITYQGCGQAAEVILYRVDGAGHTWPGGGWLPRWLTGETNREIDASALMWDFFRAHRLG